MDSLKTRDERLMAETNLFIDNALRDGIIDWHAADSLHVLTGLAAEDRVNIGVLKGIMDDLDSLYDASIRTVNEYADQSMVFYKGMLPSILSVPDDYLSPEERRHKEEMEAARRVKESMASTFKAEEMSPFLKWVSRIGKVAFRNDYGLSGKAIPQKGGLYYIYIPAGQPQPSSPY